MIMQPAARVGDPVAHTIPPVLAPAPGSPNVLIENRPAWRGISAAQAAQLLNAMKDAAIEIKKAEVATEAATGTQYQGAAEANELKTKVEQNKKLADMIMGFAAVADIHVCAMVIPPPPHGPGVVIGGSETVLINGQPACRAGDTIQEANVLANVPPITNRIVSGSATVLIGG
jgi:uncharacterized Zn-binding protein involved in type VI secretion